MLPTPAIAAVFYMPLTLAIKDGGGGGGGGGGLPALHSFYNYATYIHRA